MNLAELQSAIDYVRRHGTPLEKARLEHIVYGEPAPDDVRQQLERSQRSDGGWAAIWAPEYSSLDATCYQLAQAEELGIDLRSLMVVDAIRFLAERQRFDGSWEEEAAEAEHAPLWARPGEDVAKLYVTANCAFWVAMTGLIPSAAHDAALLLSFHLDENGMMPSFTQTHWLATALWRHQEMDDETLKGLTYLRGRVPDLSAGNLAWMILALRQGGVSAEHDAVGAGVERLISLRDPAGHWPPDEGADNAAHVTVEAIRALQMGGALP